MTVWTSDDRGLRAGIVAGTSSVLATLVTAVLIVAQVLRSPSVEPSALLSHWAAAAVVWLGIYMLVLVTITTGSTVREIRIAGGRVFQGWTYRYFRRLILAQYFTGISALMVLSLWRAPVDLGSLLPLITSGQLSALAVAGTASALGLMGAGIVAISALPPRRVAVAAEPTELQLLHEIVDLLRSRTTRNRMMVLGSSVEDPAEAVGRLEQGQRAMLEIMQSLAVAVEQFQHRLGEMQLALPESGANGPAQGELLSRPDLEQATAELRSAVAVLSVSTTRFEELLGLLARSNLPSADGAEAIGLRAQVSTELRELLREMNPGTSGSAPR